MTQLSPPTVPVRVTDNDRVIEIYFEGEWVDFANIGITYWSNPNFGKRDRYLVACKQLLNALIAPLERISQLESSVAAQQLVINDLLRLDRRSDAETAVREWVDAKHEWAADVMNHPDDPDAGIRTSRLRQAEWALRKVLKDPALARFEPLLDDCVHCGRPHAAHLGSDDHEFLPKLNIVPPKEAP